MLLREKTEPSMQFSIQNLVDDGSRQPWLMFDLDRRRAASMAHIPDLTPPERFNAEARIGENSLTIAWVRNSLDQRCASYRLALEHLAVGEPEMLAGDADRVLTQLQQTIEANEVLVAVPGIPVAVAARQAAAK